MSYSICGLIIPHSEESICVKRSRPVVTLNGGVSLIPLDRDYLFLNERDETSPNADFNWELPPWLSEMSSCFSRSAYIEAEFWGGTGMQASVVLEKNKISSGPVISSAAINFALRKMGIENASSVSSFGLPFETGGDPFEIVGLGRQRSIDGWLREAVERGVAANGGVPNSSVPSDDTTPKKPWGFLYVVTVLAGELPQ